MWNSLIYIIVVFHHLFYLLCIYNVKKENKIQKCLLNLIKHFLKLYKYFDIIKKINTNLINNRCKFLII